jgi:hypothetical protein
MCETKKSEKAVNKKDGLLQSRLRRRTTNDPIRPLLIEVGCKSIAFIGPMDHLWKKEGYIDIWFCCSPLIKKFRGNTGFSSISKVISPFFKYGTRLCIFALMEGLENFRSF